LRRTRTALNKRRDVADSPHFFGIAVGNLDPGLVFERHDELDHVEACGMQIVVEARLVGHPVDIDAQPGGDKPPNAFSNILHETHLAISARAAIAASTSAGGGQDRGRVPGRSRHPWVIIDPRPSR
jgi:hypothetical protein